ncbi:SDR family oxidoreductase [Flavimarina sp. Hel_I_48]|uniref:SDR family oxidoreductase n=1 Tax=Flavimarina sp. Hel_I_48 TaxID=1392488 RepID=UPI0004DF4A10|nr:NAD(P)H-binding protein [Flavimarina sp. Hel_I_48]
MLEGKILLAGASGALGMEILKLLANETREVRCLTRTRESAEKVGHFSNEVWQANAVENPEDIKDITKGISVIISALGESLSLFTQSEDTYYESNYLANKAILDDALRHNVKRFIFVSIKGADTSPEFEIPRTHNLFEDDLIKSGIEYTILRPTGFFSGLNDLIIMGKRKIIPVVGSGSALTNSIHHKDLAKVIVSFLQTGPKIAEVGGPEVHTRKKMAAMIAEKTGARLIFVPKWLAKLGSKPPKLFAKNLGQNLSYFIYITTHDMVNPEHGTITFKEYLQTLDLNKIP